MSRLADRRTILACAAAAMALFFWASLPALSAPFLSDDFILLNWSQPRTLAAAQDYFATDWGGGNDRGGYYRPLINLSLGFDHWRTGQDPRGAHQTNLVLHVLATLCAFALARQLAGAAAALLASVLFLLHPMHDLSVFWLAGRTDLLCGLFFLLALWLSVAKTAALRVLAPFVFLLALLAKEMAATLPLVVAMHAFLSAPPTEAGVRRRLGAAVRAALPFLLVFALYMVVRVEVLGGIGGDARLVARSSAALVGGARLILWSVYPWDLGIVEGLATAPVLVAVAALVAVIAVVLAWQRRALTPAIAFALGFLAITMLPVLGQPASWYVYIPSFGACLLFAILLLRLPQPLALAAAAALALCFAWSLRANASAVREAADIVDSVLADLDRRGGSPYLVNAPICLDGRLPMLTSRSQYLSALALRGSAATPQPLSYAYIGDAARFVPIVTTAPGTIDTSVFGDLDTFIVFGDLARPPRPPLGPGTLVAGRDASYAVRFLAEDDKIRGVSIRAIRCDRQTVVLEYRPGGLRAVPFQCPQ